MIELIKHDLGLLGIHHDKFASEAELQAAGAPERAEATLRAKGLVYQGVLEAPKGETPEDWEPVELTLFRSTEFGDDQDRPMKKSNGAWTYFGADAAYHLQKAESADHLVNIWGADHAGTVKRIQAAVTALTDGRVDLDVKIIQMVKLLRAGEPIKMSKRSGNFVTLADVVGEVGKDVVRFMMLTKRADTPLEFDFAKVVEASKDNPVFYVQYAHARIASLQRKAAELGVDSERSAVTTRLDSEELGLVKLLAQYPRTVEAAALAHEPHRIAFYLNDLASAFHALWNRGNDDPTRRFVVDDHELTRARLELARGVAQDHPFRPGVDGRGGSRGDAVMGDARSADDRLPWLVPPRPAKPVSAARRARTPLLLLLGLFCFTAIAIMAYLAGRGLTEAAPVATPKVAAAPAPTPVPAPQPPAPVPPPPVALTPAPVVAPAPPVAVSERAAPAKPRATRPKVSRKAETRASERRRVAARPAHGVTVHRNRGSARAAPRRYRWPKTFAARPSGRVIQLGAYPSGHQTMAAWQRLRRAYPHLASMPRKVIVSRARPGRPRYYRLRVGTRSASEARALCDTLHRIGRGCIVV